MTNFTDGIGLLSGFRKLSVMFTIIALGSTFLVTGYISGGEYVKLLVGVGVAFMATNGLEHTMNAVKVWLKERGNGKS